MGWYERWTAWTERHRFAVDATGVAATGLWVVIGSAAIVSGGGAYGGSTWSAALWAVALWAPLAWRHVRPVGATATVAAAALGHVLAGMPLVLPADVAILVVLYAVTVRGPAWAHRAAIATALVGSALLTLFFYLVVGDLSGAVGMGLMGAVSAVAVWALALMRRARRETVEALRDRARRLEVERDQQARIATSAERARIAREMHDIVAHSLTVIIAQADGGRYAAATSPEAAARALGVVSETGRAALADMRRLLGVLRSDDDAAPRVPLPGGAPAALDASPGAPAGGAAPLTPQPDDADLESLVAQARGSGMQVSLVRVGTPRRLPPGAGLTLHRICQEALTNVRKHAGPSPTVTVALRWTDRAVELAVSDDGRGAAASADGADAPGGQGGPGGAIAPGAPGGPGFGLLGMRERAALFGGTVTVGPRPGGGWRVRFAMPLPAGPGVVDAPADRSPAPAPGLAPVLAPAPAPPPAPEESTQ
ncbi:sensor histidine kinase [Puerhibacterium sp. TATVAM-FAB25]|uniref:sensor histidine kinase n=1 Tax=Puerhibacterium sp. TATVAM-FAB25 TaxID=3093699 RepID=UPI00397C1E74